MAKKDNKKRLSVLWVLLLILLLAAAAVYGVEVSRLMAGNGSDELIGILIGAVGIIILFALLIIRGYWIALHAADRFSTMLAVGITTLLAVQVFLNIGVVTNFIPNTGISLPFFSYGGTALWIHMAEMGIILAVSRQIPAPKQE